MITGHTRSKLQSLCEVYQWSSCWGMGMLGRRCLVHNVPLCIVTPLSQHLLVPKLGVKESCSNTHSAVWGQLPSWTVKLEGTTVITAQLQLTLFLFSLTSMALSSLIPSHVKCHFLLRVCLSSLVLPYARGICGCLFPVFDLYCVGHPQTTQGLLDTQNSSWAWHL